MALTSPDSLRSPDPTDPYNLVSDLAVSMGTVQTALERRANSYKGTSAQRIAFTTAPEGVHWQDTDGVKGFYARQGGTWVLVVAPRRRGTSTGSSGTLTQLGTTGIYSNTVIFRAVGGAPGAGERIIWGALGVGSGWGTLMPVTYSVDGSDALLTTRFTQINNSATQSNIVVWWEVVPI